MKAKQGGILDCVIELVRDSLHPIEFRKDRGANSWSAGFSSFRSILMHVP